MVIYQVHAGRFPLLETENDPPIGSHGYGPKTLELACQRVQPEAWKIHVLDFLCAIEQAKDVFDSLDVLRVDAAAIAIFEQALWRKLTIIGRQSFCSM